MGIRFIVIVLLVIPDSLALAATFHERSSFSGLTMEYAVVLPDDYDEDRSYPAVLAFPGGGQSMRIVDSMVAANWRDEAQSRGYIVISPAAPDGELFFRGGDVVFPAFLEQLLKDYKIADGKFHVAGISNGGISAFHIAASYPDYFLSVTGLPGYLPAVSDKRIAALAPLCLYMYVGERDRGWLRSMERQAEALRERGHRVELWIEPGEGHVMSTLTGTGSARLFDNFEEAESGCG